jgi:hypothetical protein
VVRCVFIILDNKLSLFLVQGNDVYEYDENDAPPDIHNVGVDDLANGTNII